MTLEIKTTNQIFQMQMRSIETDDNELSRTKITMSEKWVSVESLKDFMETHKTNLYCYLVDEMKRCEE